MTKKEHNDVYIAAIVGGIALVLIWLYMQTGVAVAASLPDNTTAAGDTVPQTPYNYNVAPYDPGPPISFAFPPVPTSGSDNINVGGCGCPCGPQNGGNNFNTTTSQFQTLMGP